MRCAKSAFSHDQSKVSFQETLGCVILPKVIFKMTKIFNISIFTRKCQIIFGRLTFSHKFEGINDFSNHYFVFLEVLKIFLYCCLKSVGHTKNTCNFYQISFGRLTFTRKNGEIKDFSFLNELDSKLFLFWSIHKYWHKNIQYLPIFVNMLCYCHYSKELKCVDIF